MLRLNSPFCESKSRNCLCILSTKFCLLSDDRRGRLISGLEGAASCFFSSPCSESMADPEGFTELDNNLAP